MMMMVMMMMMMFCHKFGHKRGIFLPRVFFSIAPYFLSDLPSALFSELHFPCDFYMQVEE